MYILVADDLKLTLRLYYADDFELSDTWYYYSQSAYDKAKYFIIETILH